MMWSPESLLSQVCRCNDIISYLSRYDPIWYTIRTILSVFRSASMH